MIPSKSSHQKQYETSHLCSNRKILIIFVLGIIMSYIMYYFLFRQVPYLNVINIKNDKIRSPFYRTLGFIRLNSVRYERLVTLEKYRPFFADLHYSMPDFISQLNYTADGWKSAEHTYKVVADTMELILKTYLTIEGILYFHFDAWIIPFGFEDMNFRNIWFPDVKSTPFTCINNTAGSNWLGWTYGYHNVAKAVMRNITKTYPRRFIFDENIFCTGWSDIYYIPRRFFPDFITLTNMFYRSGSVYEVAVPTMLNIIDVTHRSTPFHSVITRLVDCWGNCCANGANPVDIQQKRCGHRIDLTNDIMRKLLVELLDSQAIYLNKTIFNKPRK